MKIRIPNDDESKDIRKILVGNDVGIGLKRWLKIHMDIDADDSLLEALMMHFEACKIAGMEFIDIEDAIEAHKRWQNNSL